MKKILVFSSLFMIFIHASLFEKTKTLPSRINGIRIKYLSPSAAKNFYQLPRKDKLNLIKNNPFKAILCTYAAASLTHTALLTIDIALKQLPLDNYALYPSVVIIYPFFVIGHPSYLHLRNFYLLYKLIKDKNEYKGNNFFGVADVNETLSGHQYYKAPTLAYSYRFFTFIKNLIVKKENKKKKIKKRNKKKKIKKCVCILC